MSKRTKKAATVARTQLPIVCVIEDDAAVRDTLRMLLEEEGYPVMEAADGLAGYRLLMETDQRLIAVVDHKMPRMDGCDLLERIAQDAALRARHTYIMLSASPKRAEAECGETLEELAAPLVPKPFDIDEVLGAVAEAAQRLNTPSSAPTPNTRPTTSPTTSPMTSSAALPDEDQAKTRRRTPRR